MSHNPYHNPDMAPLAPAASSSRRKVRFQTPGSPHETPAAVAQAAVNLAGAHFDPPTPSTQNGPRVHFYTPSSDFTPAMALAHGQALCNHVHQNHLPCTGIAQPHATTPTHHLGDITGFPGSAHQMRQGRMQTQMQIPPPQIEADPALGIGLTESQTAAENLRKGIQEGACDGGEFKPANPDKHQQYWVQEVNGAVALMPRHVIDRMGASVRWVMRNGDFVAVRLDAGPCPH